MIYYLVKKEYKNEKMSLKFNQKIKCAICSMMQFSLS